MKIIADTHTHTIASGDAFSTLYENIQAAKRKGVKFLCMTEHAYSALPGAPVPTYFKSMHALPKEFDGVQLIRGVEVNVMDYDGKLDMPPDILDWLEWVIASMHTSVIKPRNVKDHTKAWLAVAENPLVDVIGHCDDPQYTFDVDRVIKAFGIYGKIVEVNEQSSAKNPAAREVCKKILLACKKYSVPIVVSSDGHFADKIAVFTKSEKLLEEIDFPDELVMNADEERFAEMIEKKRRKI